MYSIKQVYNKNQVENDSFHRIFHQRTKKSLPEGSILPKSFSCDPKVAKEIANNFERFKQDNSRCPIEDWLVAMSKVDSSPKFFVNVGVNRGYNIALWMNVFQPQLQYRTMNWYDEIKHYVKGDAPYLCGACADCKQNYPFFQPLQSEHLTILGVDLNCWNVEAIDSMMQRVNDQINTKDLTLFTTCAGISNDTYPLTMTKCWFGWETCGISSEISDEKEIVTTPIITFTDLMHSFLVHVIQNHYQKNKEFLQSPFNADHPFYHKLIRPFFHASETKPYHPLIDVLMIDTEGNDYSVLKGSHLLLKARSIRVVIFEYHNYSPWKYQRLEDAKNEMDIYGYDCYFQGRARLWKITGVNCWSNEYEFHFWSNVMCVRREDIWYEALQPFVVTRPDETRPGTGFPGPLKPE
jgi:hypothetical protein